MKSGAPSFVIAVLLAREVLACEGNCFAPGIGSDLTQLLRGQPDVGVRTLGRFYAIHTLFLPALLFSLAAIHLAMVIKQGIAPLPVKQFASASPEDYDRLAASLKKEGRPST